MRHVNAEIEEYLVDIKYLKISDY